MPLSRVFKRITPRYLSILLCVRGHTGNFGELDRWKRGFTLALPLRTTCVPKEFGILEHLVRA